MTNKYSIRGIFLCLALMGFVTSCGQDVATIAGNLERGGQLFDHWITVKGAATPTSMTDGNGNTIAGARGHGYRCKNCHGWDYKGSAGIYGPSYKNKSYVVAVDLSAKTGKTEADITAHIKNGGTGMPAYGSVLDTTDILDLVKFLKEGVYDTAGVFTIDATKDEKYALVSGADASAGASLYASKCASCHGANGTTLTWTEDEKTFNAGVMGRQHGYEIHHKIKFGHPGSAMGSRTTVTTEVRDILAALCNTTSFPAGNTNGTSITSEQGSCGSYYQ